MIRELTGDDIPAILDMGQDMQEGSAYSNAGWSSVKVAQLCVNLINEPSMQAWVAETGGKVVGMFFGAIHEYYFSNVRRSSDLLLYVRPEFRGGSHAYKLVNKYIGWAIDSGVESDHIGVGVTTGICDEQVDRLYTKMGFERTGALYNLRVQ